MEKSRENTRGGFILIALVATILPLVMVAGAVATTMTHRNSRLMSEVDLERALLAAEAGIDDALFRVDSGIGLASGDHYTVDLGEGMSFTVDVLFLKTDAVDNDKDGEVDEADEDVYRLVVTGDYRGVKRRLAAYLGPVPLAPPIEAAINLFGLPTDKIEVEDKSLASGIDRRIDGSGGAGVNLPGIAIQAPNTAADILTKLQIDPTCKIIGAGATPSVGGATSGFDLAAFVKGVKNSANVLLTNQKYDGKKGTAGFDFGDATAGDYKIFYRDGELELKNLQRGAGILVVTGELEIEDGFRWDGIVIALGHEVELEKSVFINGALIMGPDVEELEIEHSATVQYSSEAITAVSKLIPGSYVAFNGWQEISKN